MSKHANTPTRSRRIAPTTQRGTSYVVHQGDQPMVQLLLPMEPALQMRDHLEEIMVDAGTLLVHAYLQDEAEFLAGPKFTHGGGKSVYRHGTEEGHIVIAGKKIPIRHPRLRSHGKEVPMTRDKVFQDPRAMQKAVHGHVLRGISTRRYEDAVDGFGQGFGLRRSSVSRHWKAASARSLAALMQRPLGDLDLVSIMIDGVGFADQVIVVALGIDEFGCKHTLGLWSGATENSTVVGALLDDMMSRGLRTDRRYLFVLDGAKALSRAVKDRFGEQAPIQRCLVHKRRNIMDLLPQQYHVGVSMRLSAAWGMVSHSEAKQELNQVLTFLESINTHAARSLEEAFEETLTLQRIGVPTALRAFFASTNAIENLFSAVRKHTNRVKRWRKRPAKGESRQDMVLRWAAATMLDTESRFNRIKGFRALPALVSKLQAIDQKTMTA